MPPRSSSFTRELLEPRDWTLAYMVTANPRPPVLSCAFLWTRGSMPPLSTPQALREKQGLCFSQFFEVDGWGAPRLECPLSSVLDRRVNDDRYPKNPERQGSGPSYEELLDNGARYAKDTMNNLAGTRVMVRYS